MKKSALFILLCIYTLSSLGVGVNKFYCCGILQTTGLTLGQSTGNSCGNGDEKDGCCKTNFKSLQIKDSHVASGDVTVALNHFTLLNLFTPSFSCIPVAISAMEIAYASHAPPVRQSIPIYIFYCVYRI